MKKYYYDNPLDALFMVVNHGVKIKDLAAQIGHNPSYISQVIMGYRSMSAGLARKLVKASNGKLTYDELFKECQ